MELEVVPRTLSCGGAGGTPLFLLTGVEDDGLIYELGKGEEEEAGTNCWNLGKKCEVILGEFAIIIRGEWGR